MSLVLADRVRQTTTSTGTGTITLDGSVEGFQSFAVIGNANTTYYTIAGGTQWEVGIGTYSSGTLARTTVISSSTGSKLDLAAGTKDVFVTLPAEHTITSIVSDDGSVTINQTGSEVEAKVYSSPRLITEVRNETGETLTKGTVVYINGASGNKPTVTKAIATSDSTSAQTLGLVLADISTNNNGYAILVGDIAGLNTFAYAAGTQLYLSSSVAGEYTSTKQYAPNHLVYVGVVTRSHQNQGSIEVNIQNGYEMDELHNVSAQNPNDGDILVYSSATNLWVTAAPSATWGA